MFGLGMGELALVLLVAFLVLGPTQVPKLMRDLGKTIRDLRRVGEDVKQQLVLDDEIRKPLEELREAMVVPLDTPVYPRTLDVPSANKEVTEPASPADAKSPQPGHEEARPQPGPQPPAPMQAGARPFEEAEPTIVSSTIPVPVVQIEDEKTAPVRTPPVPKKRGT